MWGQVIASWWIWVVPAAFVAVLVYAFNPKRKRQFQDDARIPFDQDKPQGK